MKVILEPTVTVVGHSQFIEHPTYKIPDDGDDHTKLGAFAAKGCYDSYSANGRPNEENQLAILEHRHGSVLEHATVSLFIEGITRGLTLEMNRHRTFAISQRSTRYTAEEDASIVLEPYYAHLWDKLDPEYRVSEPYPWHTNHSTPESWLLCEFLNECERSFDRYRNQVDRLMKLNPLNLEGFDLRKWARGKARNILPHALETRVTYTNNHRGWRWFIESRSDRHAEPEIRRLAHHTLLALREVAPVYYNDFEIAAEYDDIYEWKPKYNKV
jgi:thymidylate synthase (FAD)